MILTRLHESPNSWPEDFGLENGNYTNKCLDCKKQFIAHKRRVICRLCTLPYIYISGKIGDLPEIEYRGNFRVGEDEVRQLGYKPINPCSVDHSKHDGSYGEYMRHDIRAMLRDGCKTIYMLRNWKESRGARIELNLAIDLGFHVIFQKAGV